MCTCSLLGIRPHPVTRRSEWRRPLRALQQDRLDELFGDMPDVQESSFNEEHRYSSHREPSSDEEPPTSRKSSSPEQDPSEVQEPSSGEEHSYLRQDELNSDEELPTSGRSAPSSPEMPENEDFVHWEPPGFSGGSAGSGEPSTEEDFAGDQPEESSEEELVRKKQDSSSGPELPEDIQEPALRQPSQDSLSSSVQRSSSVEHLSPLVEEQQYGGGQDMMLGLIFEDESTQEIVATGHDHEESDDPRSMNTSAPNLRSIQTSDDEHIYDTWIEPHTKANSQSGDSSSERVGQMRRGFGAEAETEGPSDSPSTPDQATSGEAEESTFNYEGTKAEMGKDNVLAVATHNLKLTHRLSRAAATDIAGLVSSFGANQAIWDYRSTRKWIAKQTGVVAVRYD